ncbi:hypothetical protein BOH78_4355 [Pichia kudriavzevii]|uniref:Uncharacterized protein n=1 Tax=Pichia kudriavzevii TaxID=4909 RepID=A0A099NVS8_PICKU|nr:hypothetical protein JL09_g4798 [Pichia kudriavzevii]ONH70242.1 hypothetical protein BOH78_5390 [Pichia kudriavzevii]ONH71672.1 hypothetical protein BOH78_4355 [Pichia kudriavzevii]
MAVIECCAPAKVSPSMPIIESLDLILHHETNSGDVPRRTEVGA